VIPLPTWRLAAVAVVGALVLLALPADLGYRLLLVNVGVVALFVLDAAICVAPHRVEIERVLPGIVPLDGRATVRWDVRNPTRRPLRIAVADELAPSLRADARRARAVVPSRGTATASVAIRPGRRGRFHVTDLTVRVDGPLGLAARQHTRHVPEVLRVYPPFHSRDEAELRIRRTRLLEVGLRSARGRGAGTEFEQLREYSNDDEFRRIDWAATARTGRPIVRTYRAERNQNVVCLLDNGRVMAGRVGDVPRVEHAMDAVMMLTHVATRLGDRTGLVAFDRLVRAAVPPGHRVDQLARITEAMYELEPVLDESDYLAAFTHTLSRFRRRSLLVLLTDLSAAAVTESLLPALPVVVENHLVVIGSVQDPDVVAWARGYASDASDAYRKAAAVLALEERRRVTARLRALGVTVIDEQPGRLAPALADAYLRVKATGRL
jgi:uncharacterized protein (DUF58 family)